MDKKEAIKRQLNHCCGKMEVVYLLTTTTASPADVNKAIAVNNKPISLNFKGISLHLLS